MYVNCSVSKIILNVNRISPFITQSRFLLTLKKKTFENNFGNEKMLVTSIFPFNYNVFYHSQNKFNILIKSICIQNFVIGFPGVVINVEYSKVGLNIWHCY